MTTATSIDLVSARLRAIRRSKSLSLSDVEVLSNGTLKAVVLGSYERGARTLSVKRAIAIAELYQVSVAQLFGDEEPVEVLSVDKTVIDLRAINRRAQSDDHPHRAKYLLLARLALRITRSRQDWNGEVLSIRQADVETLSLLLDEPISKVLLWLDDERVLLKTSHPKTVKS
jgi:transcriptional regulator with XRE-family HTH domain